MLQPEVARKLRREPKQPRGLRKVEHILTAAELVFAEAGFERATTNAIAVRADVSIGSLYQFFDSKDAILEALASKYLAQSQSVVHSVLEECESDSIDTLVRKMLLELVLIQERRPYFLQCLSVSRPWCALTETVVRFQEAIIDEVTTVLSRRGVQDGQVPVRVKARICVDTMSAVLPLVLYARGRDRKGVIEEVREMLVGYISSNSPSKEAI